LTLQGSKEDMKEQMFVFLKWAKICLKRNKGKFELGDFVILKDHVEHGFGMVTRKKFYFVNGTTNPEDFSYNYEVYWLDKMYRDVWDESDLRSAESYREEVAKFMNHFNNKVASLDQDLRDIIELEYYSGISRD
jgi:hypothetical protein